MWGLVCLLLGYIIGRLEWLVARAHAQPDQPATPDWRSPKSSRTAARQDVPATKPAIEISSSKVVTKLDTTAIQKPADVTLGTVTSKQEDITAAAAKLAGLKGK